MLFPVVSGILFVVHKKIQLKEECSDEKRVENGGFTQLNIRHGDAAFKNLYESDE